MKLKLLIANFPYGHSENPDIRKWFTRTILAAKKDPRIGEIEDMDVDDTPVTISRNRVLKYAQDNQVDLVCMVDSDMKPDLYLGQPGPSVKPFFESSLDFMLNHRGPCVVAAPYCGPPPVENPYIFRWARLQSDHPNPDMKLISYDREEASLRMGFEEVAALPTGLILIDVRCLQAISPPWFDYTYADPPFNTRKATTEDVYFTRNLSLAGVPQYVNWDAWAGHHKRKCVGKPMILTSDAIGEEFRQAIARGYKSDERLMDIRPEGVRVNIPSNSQNGQGTKPCFQNLCK